MVTQIAIAARKIWVGVGDTPGDGRGDQMPPDEIWDPADAAEIGKPELAGTPREDWFFWLMMAGRGSGKTRAGAEDAWWFGFMNPGSRIAIVAPTSNDCRKTCFEGESGLLARVPPQLVANWNRGEMLLTLTNGTIFQGYSAEEPDRLRGPQHHRAWCDELAAWRYLDDTLDNLLMGLRLGKNPRIVATTTPRPIKRLKEIVKDSTTVVDTVSTYENLKNLPRIFVEKILQRYAGTRLGRQELNAEILEDNPGALWQRNNLDANRVVAKVGRGTLILANGSIVVLQRIVVAVDPSTTNNEGSDETGIVVCGICTNGRGYVLADLSMQGTPGEWGEAAIQAYDDWFADRIVYESNQGGDMVRHTLVTSASAMRAAGKRSTDFAPISDVWASKGKVTRAEPVSALYEQNRISHLGTLAKLEDQMCEFTSDFDRKKMGYSPDRVDALVWAFTELMLSDANGLNIADYYRQEHSRHTEAVNQAKTGLPTIEGMVWLKPPEKISTAYGMLGHKYDRDPDHGGMMHVHRDDVAALKNAGFTLPTEEDMAA